MGGQPYKVSKLAHKFRTELLMEHFGLSKKDEIIDPLAAREKMVEIAHENGKLFFDIFKCEPDDSLKTYDEVRASR